MTKMIITTNPATEEKLAEYNMHSTQEALEISKSSKEAFFQWRELTIEHRGKFFTKLASVLRENKGEYATLMTNEMGKPITESLAEVEKCAWLLDVIVENAAQWLVEREIKADGQKHIITYEPLGPIYLVMPWNYPFWQVFKVAMPPLMAGNTILLKHSKNVTGCALAIQDACKKAGFPEDVFQTVVISHETSDKLIEDDNVAAVSLTGSVGAGSKIGSLATKNIKKTVLELGGSDPFVVLEDADIEKAAKAAALGRTSNSGQVCIGAKRFIVVKNIAEQFSELFVKYVKERVVGDPLDPKTHVGPLVDKNAVEEMRNFVSDATGKGATLLAGGKEFGKGYFFEPTVLFNVTMDMLAAKDETFGPVAPIIVVENEEEAIKVANDSEFGLNASVWTTNLQRGQIVARRIEAGGVFINHISVSHPLLPLGGIKKSGYGRELGEWGIKEFVNVKPINIYEG